MHGQRLESSQSTPANIGMAGSRPAGGIGNHFPQHSSQQVLGSKLERSDEVISKSLIFIPIIVDQALAWFTFQKVNRPCSLITEKINFLNCSLHKTCFIVLKY